MSKTVFSGSVTEIWIPTNQANVTKPAMYVMLLRIKFKEKYISVKTAECVENSPARLLPFGM
jgi:hypothetical protein